MNNIEKLELLLEDKVSPECRSFIEDYYFDPDANFVIEVDCQFVIDEVFTDKNEDRNVDQVYQNVKHALPPKMFPLLSTLGGFMLACGISKNDSNIYYWDHEQGVEAFEISKVAGNIKELKELIKIDEGKNLIKGAYNGRRTYNKNHSRNI